MAHRIDTHIHIIPSVYRQAILDAGGDPSGWHIPDWTEQLAEEFMDKIDVHRAVWSITAPGPAIAGTGPEARKLATACNEEVSQMCGRNADRHRFFLSLPSFVDVEGCVAEVERAMKLPHKPAGVVIMTSYSDKLLGDPAFDDIWAAFDKHSLIVFIHPAAVKIGPMLIAGVLPQPTVDYPQNSTRAAVDLLLRGHLHRYNNIKVILSHAGCTLPYLKQRVHGSIQVPEVVKRLHQGIDHDTFLKDYSKLYFDLAMSTTKLQLFALLETTTIDKVLFGSDWPYAGPNRIVYNVEMLNKNIASGPQFEQFKQTDSENARKLFGW